MRQRQRRREAAARSEGDVEFGGERVEFARHRDRSESAQPGNVRAEFFGELTGVARFVMRRCKLLGGGQTIWQEGADDQFAVHVWGNVERGFFGVRRDKLKQLCHAFSAGAGMFGREVGAQLTQKMIEMIVVGGMTEEGERDHLANSKWQMAYGKWLYAIRYSPLASKFSMGVALLTFKPLRFAGERGVNRFWFEQHHVAHRIPGVYQRLANRHSQRIAFT